MYVPVVCMIHFSLTQTINVSNNLLRVSIQSSYKAQLSVYSVGALFCDILQFRLFSKTTSRLLRHPFMNNTFNVRFSYQC